VHPHRASATRARCVEPRPPTIDVIDGREATGHEAVDCPQQRPASVLFWRGQVKTMYEVRHINQSVAGQVLPECGLVDALERGGHK
jgi:hypothetical protein